MVRLTDLSDSSREAAESLECPVFDSTPWVSADKPLRERTVTLISTAGLIQPTETTFRSGDAGYRVIPDELEDGRLSCSHVSVNFDRTGLQRDLNVILPRGRLHELVASGEVGQVAGEHYTFMGATDPSIMEPQARELARHLLENKVDSAVLAPV